MKKIGRIVKRKKKGRPAKVDLSKRLNSDKVKSAPERELRRSHRQRNVRYTFDFDDYLDDYELFEDFDDEESERRREKKLKVLLKLHASKDNTTTTESRTPSDTRRLSHALTASQSSSDSGNKPSKKRKMSDGRGSRHRPGRDDEEAEEEEDENDDLDEEDNENVEEDDEVVKDDGKAEQPKGLDSSAPGTPAEVVPSGLPLPDKKTLELILDKLQKKDIYGVYAEPVDPEELPDYHEVIEHPMDFATVRNKLGNGSYATLEQFESDVFLICSNAMQYNASDTIYYKQARSIQELAKKKFQKIRISIERSAEPKSEQKMRLSSVLKKPVKKPINWTMQDPVGSDFSSGATLATTGDFQNGSSAALAGGYERASSVDRPAEGPSLIENNIEKAEESLPGKRPVSRIERKPPLSDDNRRATYNASTQPVASSESVLSTFEGDSKQLISVGLYADHSYARSLARFAATLGPVAWSIASKRIEQALPSGIKFGRGWVGEYEPLPTPVLMLENCTLKEPPFFTKIVHIVDARKEQKMATKPVSSEDNMVTEPRAERLAKAGPSYKEGLVNASTLERKPTYFSPAVIKPTATSSRSISLPAKEQAVRVAGLEGRSSFFCHPANKTSIPDSPSFQQRNSQPKNFIEPEKRVLKQVELNCPPSGSQNVTNFVGERHVLNSSETSVSKSTEMVSKNKNLLPSGSFKQPNLNGASVGGVPNGKVNNLDNNKMSVSSPEAARAVTYFPHAQQQGLTDPVQLMRMLAEKAQNQQKASNQSPVDPSAPSLRQEDSGNAAAAAARAWMSIGAGEFKPAGENTTSHKNQISADSLYNPARDLQSQVSRVRGETPSYGMHFQPDMNSLPFHPFVPQPTRMTNDAQFQNQSMVFPQLMTTDLSRFQVQSPWQSLSPRIQPRQKQESLPPDLNISFQSSGSPGRPASSVLVDSQQPDLALQL